MDWLQQLYISSCATGFLFVIGSAFLSGLHSQGDQAGHIDSHAGHEGGLHGHGEQSVHHGHSSNHDGGSDEIANNSAAKESKMMLSQSSAASTSKASLYIKLLTMFSPLRLSLFLLCFGTLGNIFIKVLPGPLSAVPAFLGAWLATKFCFNLLSKMMSRMESSSSFRKESLIGSTGKLTVSIAGGSVGEVVIETKDTRYASVAKASKKEQNLNKLSKVIVVDVKDDILIVEPYEEEQLLSDRAEI